MQLAKQSRVHHALHVRQRVRGGVAYPPAFFMPALMPSRKAVLPMNVMGSIGQMGTMTMFPFTDL